MHKHTSCDDLEPKVQMEAGDWPDLFQRDTQRIDNECPAFW